MSQQQYDNSGLKFLLAGTIVLCVGIGLAKCNSSTPTIEQAFNQYEWLHDTHTAHVSSAQNIKIYTHMKAGVTDQKELQRINVELAGQKQICVQNAQRYNAEAQKMIKNAVMPPSLPTQIDIKECE